MGVGKSLHLRLGSDVVHLCMKIIRTMTESINRYGYTAVSRGRVLKGAVVLRNVIAWIDTRI